MTLDGDRDLQGQGGRRRNIFARNRRAPEADADTLARAAYAAQLRGAEPPPTAGSAALLAKVEGLRPVPTIAEQTEAFEAGVSADEAFGGGRGAPASRGPLPEWLTRPRATRGRRRLTKDEMQRRTWLVVALITVLCRPWAPSGIGSTQSISIALWLGLAGWTLVTPTIYFWSKSEPQGPLGAMWWLITGSSKGQPMGYRGAKVAVIGFSGFPIRALVVAIVGLHGTRANDVAVATVAVVGMAYGLRPARLRTFRARWRRAPRSVSGAAR